MNNNNEIIKKIYDFLFIHQVLERNKNTEVITTNDLGLRPRCLKEEMLNNILLEFWNKPPTKS